jgi:hypothetical protein
VIDINNSELKKDSGMKDLIEFVKDVLQKFE